MAIKASKDGNMNEIERKSVEQAIRTLENEILRQPRFDAWKISVVPKAAGTLNLVKNHPAP